MINIKIILFLLVGTLFFFFLLRWQGGALISDDAPAGIVSLELAVNKEKTATIIESWITEGVITNARNNILIDFLFIPFYMMLFYTLCGSISVRNQGRIATMGVLLAFFSLIAGFFDVLENLFMLGSTYSLFSQFTAMLTAFFAASKFILLALALLYVIFMGTPILIKKFRT